MAMKLVALGQSVENCRDWLAPSEAGKTSATIRAPVVTAWARPGRGGGDEPVDGIAGGDGGEPGAQSDVLVQRGQGVQPGLFQRPEQPGDGQHRQQ